MFSGGLWNNRNCSFAKPHTVNIDMENSTNRTRIC